VRRLPGFDHPSQNEMKGFVKNSGFTHERPLFFPFGWPLFPIENRPLPIPLTSS
jgi:hypothetical protein